MQRREASIAAHRTFVPTWLAYVSVLVANGRGEDARAAAAQPRAIDPALEEKRLRNMLRLGFTSDPRLVEGLLHVYREVGLISAKAQEIATE